MAGDEDASVGPITAGCMPVACAAGPITEGAKRRIELIENEVIDYHWKTQVTRDLVELRNIVAVAKLVIGCALQREESRGLHSNQTHPKHADTLYDTSAQRISHNDVAWRRQRLNDQQG